MASQRSRAKGETAAVGPGKPTARSRRLSASTPLREQFALELLIDFDVQGAWRRAHEALHLKPPAKRSGAAYVAMRDPVLAERIQALRAEAQNRAGINVERTEREIARLSYVDIGAFYRPDGTFKALHEIPEDARRAIVSIETEEIFEYSDDEDPAKKLDELEPIIRDLLHSLEPATLSVGARGLVAALKDAIKPPKHGKRFKCLVGYLKKIKIADKKGALELAGRRDGIFKDKMIHEAGSSLEKIIAESHKVGA